MTKTVGRVGMGPGKNGTPGRIIEVHGADADPREIHRKRAIEFWTAALQNPSESHRIDQIRAHIEALRVADDPASVVLA